MDVKVNNEDFTKAINEEIVQWENGDVENLRFAVDAIARNIIAASEWTGASPPAITRAALNVVHRAAWESFGREEHGAAHAHKTGNRRRGT